MLLHPISAKVYQSVKQQYQEQKQTKQISKTLQKTLSIATIATKILMLSLIIINEMWLITINETFYLCKTKQGFYFCCYIKTSSTNFSVKNFGNQNKEGSFILFYLFYFLVLFVVCLFLRKKQPTLLFIFKFHLYLHISFQQSQWRITFEFVGISNIPQFQTSLWVLY